MENGGSIRIYGKNPKIKVESIVDLFIDSTNNIPDVWTLEKLIRIEADKIKRDEKRAAWQKEVESMKKDKELKLSIEKSGTVDAQTIRTMDNTIEAFNVDLSGREFQFLSLMPISDAENNEILEVATLAANSSTEEKINFLFKNGETKAILKLDETYLPKINDSITYNSIYEKICKYKYYLIVGKRIYFLDDLYNTIFQSFLSRIETEPSTEDPYFNIEKS